MTGTKKSLKASGAGEDKGELVILRPSALAEAGTTGVVATGVLEAVKPNKYDKTKSDYFIRNMETNTLYILNETKSLKDQLGQLEGINDATVEIVYNGKIQTKNGKGFHDFEVFVVNG